MEKRILGRTGLEVSVLGMGGAFISRWGQTDRAEARRAVQRAFELGLNYVDTAPSYADSEEVLGYALQGVTQPFYLSTKLGGRPQPFDPKDKAALRRSVEESLRLLGRDHVDVLFIHEPDRAYNHFVVASPDYVAHVPPGLWGTLFQVTAVLLAVTEALGLFVGLRFLRGGANQ